MPLALLHAAQLRKYDIADRQRHEAKFSANFLPRDDLDLSPMSTFDRALRQIRMTRPDLVLIGLGWRTNPGLRLARQIKTDAGHSARVLLIDWPGRQPDPSPADGITPPRPTTEQVRAAVLGLLD